jgi:hypothetical protein
MNFYYSGFSRKVKNVAPPSTRTLNTMCNEEFEHGGFVPYPLFVMTVSVANGERFYKLKLTTYYVRLSASQERLSFVAALAV